MFDAQIYEYHTETLALQAMRNDSSMLAAMVPTSFKNDTSLAWYDLDLWTPLVAFCRDFVNDTLKVKHSEVDYLQEHETGNEDLARTYEAAVMALISGGDYVSIFTGYNIPGVQQMGDCNVKQSGYSVPTPTEGTLQKVIRDRTFTVGDIPYPSAMLNTSDPNAITGPLHAINLAIVNWITRQFDLPSPILLKYKLFPDLIDVYNALDDGTIDATANHCYPGGTTSIGGGIVLGGNLDLLSNRYRGVCTAGAVDDIVLVRKSSGIQSVGQLYSYLDTHNAEKLGCVDLTVPALTMLRDYPKMTTWYFESVAEAVNGLLTFNETFLPAVLMPAPTHANQVLPAGITSFTSHVWDSWTVFFRRDKVDSCGDSVLDAGLDEECEKGGSHCDDATCKCENGFAAKGNGSCKKVHHVNAGFIVLGVVVGLVVLVAIAVVVAVIVAIPFIRRRYLKEGSLRMRLAMFRNRTSNHW
eukprot:TRINITY_DN1730_c0_g1_i1.p1 TRINITY_DN1730_c0_g1~~TRINITY_DN1730_c0_g1_i1.p1  ORF type:complete len:469 (-),score=80.12 TRINITY_DN1730_c0_g1_i1:1457-2863(-)